MAPSPLKFSFDTQEVATRFIDGVIAIPNMKGVHIEILDGDTPKSSINAIQLWAHYVSQHACIMSPETSLNNLIDYHDHEHHGPCTIRNHDPKELSYSLKKIGKVLSESET
jgi:hypothetical protein